MENDYNSSLSTNTFQKEGIQKIKDEEIAEEYNMEYRESERV